MNIYFSKLIKTAERLREFNFRQLITDTDVKYSVDVPDDKGNRIKFSMTKNAGGNWKATSLALPAWVLDAEADLGEAIEENKNYITASKK